MNTVIKTMTTATKVNMNISTKLFTFIFLVFSLTACSELSGSDTGANIMPAGQKATPLGGLTTVEIAPNKFRFAGTMDNGGNSSHSFNISMRLEDGKQGTFYFFANKGLNNGVLLSVEKQNSTALLTLIINGVSHEFTKELAADNTFSLSVDVHNDHEDAHILMWDTAGPFGDMGDCAYDNTCVYNTESFTPPEVGPWGTHGKGPGAFWGYEGDSDIIIKVEGPFDPISNA